MTRVDLKAFGFPSVELLVGDVIDIFHAENGELLFLFDENHSYRAGIRQSLRNAKQLIDMEIVDFIGVEGFSGDLKPIIELQWMQVGYETLEGVQQHFAHMNVREDSIIALSHSFARVLTLLRPNVPIYGIEDKAAYERSGEEIHQWESTITDRTARAFRDALKANDCLNGGGGIYKCLKSPAFLDDLMSEAEKDTLAFIRQKVQAERPVYFVENLLKHRKMIGSKRASIINAGRMEQDEVSRIIREGGLSSFIRVRPYGFPDPTQQIRTFWQAQFPRVAQEAAQ